MTDRFLGAHTPDAGGIVNAVRRAAASKMRALQIMTAPPTYYNEKVTIKPDRAAKFAAALTAAGIEPRHVIAHGAYVLNTASPEETKAQRARSGLAKEFERSTTLGIGGCCFHPGSAGDGDPGEACDDIGVGEADAEPGGPCDRTWARAGRWIPRLCRSRGAGTKAGGLGAQPAGRIGGGCVRRRGG